MENGRSNVIAEMTAQREAAASAPYTVWMAIDDALWLRKTPDAVVDTKKLKRIADTLLSALQLSTCYFNAVQRGQETFVLVQQDRAAPTAIAAWADAAAGHGCPEAKLTHAYQVSGRWMNQPPEKTKWPD